MEFDTTGYVCADALIWTTIFIHVHPSAIRSLMLTCKLFRKIMDDHVYLRVKKYGSPIQCFKRHDCQALIYIVDSLRRVRMPMDKIGHLINLCVQFDESDVFKHILGYFSNDPIINVRYAFAKFIGKHGAIRVLDAYIRMCKDPKDFLELCSKNIIKYSPRSKQIVIAKRLIEHYEKFKDEGIFVDVCSHAIESKNFSLFELVVKTGHYDHHDIDELPDARYAKCIVDHEMPINPNVIRSAIKRDNVEVVKVFHDSGFVQRFGGSVLCTLSAIHNSIDCLKFLHENGIQWGYQTFSKAVANKSDKCLEYLQTNGCPTEEDGMDDDEEEFSEADSDDDGEEIIGDAPQQ